MPLQVGRSCLDSLNIKLLSQPNGCPRSIIDVVFEGFDAEGSGYFKVKVLAAGKYAWGLISVPKSKMNMKNSTIKQDLVGKVASDNVWKEVVKQYAMSKVVKDAHKLTDKLVDIEDKVDMHKAESDEQFKEVHIQLHDLKNMVKEVRDTQLHVNEEHQAATADAVAAAINASHSARAQTP